MQRGSKTGTHGAPRDLLYAFGMKQIVHRLAVLCAH